MPHLRFRGIAAQDVQKLSETLATELAQAINSTADNFTIEHIQTQFFNSGKADPGYPFVEVLWFERPVIQKSAVVKILTDRIKWVTHAKDIAVVFVPLNKADYFENGAHF